MYIHISYMYHKFQWYIVYYISYRPTLFLVPFFPWKPGKIRKSATTEPGNVHENGFQPGVVGRLRGGGNPLGDTEWKMMKNDEKWCFTLGDPSINEDVCKESHLLFLKKHDQHWPTLHGTFMYIPQNKGENLQLAQWKTGGIRPSQLELVSRLMPMSLSGSHRSIICRARVSTWVGSQIHRSAGIVAETS